MRDLRTEMKDLRGETQRGFADVLGEIDALRLLMFRMFAGLIAALVSASVLHGI
jgi:hypothetical protein